MKDFSEEARSQDGANTSSHMMHFMKVRWRKERQMDWGYLTITKANGSKVNLRMIREVVLESCFKMAF